MNKFLIFLDEYRLRLSLSSLIVIVALPVTDLPILETFITTLNVEILINFAFFISRFLY